jgi:hypothetical protein
MSMTRGDLGRNPVLAPDRADDLREEGRLDMEA